MVVILCTKTVIIIDGKLCDGYVILMGYTPVITVFTLYSYHCFLRYFAILACSRLWEASRCSDCLCPKKQGRTRGQNWPGKHSQLEFILGFLMLELFHSLSSSCTIIYPNSNSPETSYLGKRVRSTILASISFMGEIYTYCPTQKNMG